MKNKEIFIFNVSASSPAKSTGWSLFKFLEEHCAENVQLHTLGPEATGQAMYVVHKASLNFANNGKTLFAKTGWETRPGRKETDQNSISVFVLRFMVI